MTGPRRLIVLDGVPREQWKLDRRCAVVIGGALWFVVDEPCLACLQNDTTSSFTFISPEGDAALCTMHGQLFAAPLIIKRSYSVTLDTRTAEGDWVYTDRMLVPTEMSWIIRDLLLKQILAEAEEHERERLAP